MKKSKFPLPELTIVRGQLLYNDIPIAQASSAEKIKIACAIKAAVNPKMKVMIIKNGNDLDEESLKTLYDFATEKGGGYQLWIEKVATTDTDKNIIVRLTVTDNGGLKDTADSSIYVMQNVPPILNSVSITGPVQVNEYTGAQYLLTANYSDGSSREVTDLSSWNDNSARHRRWKLSGPLPAGSHMTSTTSSARSTAMGSC